MRLELTPGAGLRSTRQRALGVAARRFATSLTRWLYGSRRSFDVEPVTLAVRRELARTPPYIPADQRGSHAGRPDHVDLALQTRTSGVLTLTVTDPRTSYQIPAGFERRHGCWRIVHLNTH